MLSSLPLNQNLYRKCVGMMILNARNEIFITRRKDLTAHDPYAWQMPQGGIDDHETPHQAALREMVEEIGTVRVKLLAQASEWIYYDFPDTIQQKSVYKNYKGQRQMWFLFRFEGEERDINLQTEHPEFCEWRWASKQKVLAHVVPFKLKAYQQVFQEFSSFV